VFHVAHGLFTTYGGVGSGVVLLQILLFARGSIRVEKKLRLRPPGLVELDFRMLSQYRMQVSGAGPLSSGNEKMSSHLL
jgi:hypothetical protein